MVAELLMPALNAVATFLGSLIENVFGELTGDKAEALIESFKAKKLKNELQSVIVSEIEDFSKHHKGTAARFFDKIREIQWDKDVLEISPPEEWSNLTSDQVAKAVVNSLVPIPVESLYYQFQRNIDHFIGLHGYNKLICDFITKLLRIQDARAQYYLKQLSAKEKANVGLTVNMIAKLIAPMHVKILQSSDAIRDAQELFVCMIEPSALAASSMMKYWESKINPKVESEVRNYLTWVYTQYLACTEFVKSPYLTELERKEQQRELVYWERVALSSSRWGKYIIPTGGKFNLPKADSTAVKEKKAAPKLPPKALISPTPKPAAPSSAHLGPARSSGQEVVTLQASPTMSPNSSSRFFQEPQKDKPKKELASKYVKSGEKITVTIYEHDEKGLEEIQTPIPSMPRQPKKTSKDQVTAPKEIKSEGYPVQIDADGELPSELKNIANGEEFIAICNGFRESGLTAEWNGYSVFIPDTEITTSYVYNLSAYKGDPLCLRALRIFYTENRKEIIASRREVLEQK